MYWSTGGREKRVEICRQTVTAPEMTLIMQANWDAEVSNQTAVD